MREKMEGESGGWGHSTDLRTGGGEGGIKH